MHGWRFELVKWVGAGATSDVWRARDRETGAEVALKVAKTEEGASVLAAEADTLACAFSPHLPLLIDVGRVPSGAFPPIGMGEPLSVGRPYLAITWMPGRTLDPSLARTDEDRRAIALTVARDIGGAIARLDAAGVAHGDIKPANIRLVDRHRRGATSKEGPTWEANLLDLGLAADANVPSPAGGTPRYLPPELWTGARGGDGRARDRFALGLVLAEILVPRLVEAGDLAGEARRTQLPSPFHSWCSALLAPDPGARPRAAWIAEQARLAVGSSRSEHPWLEDPPGAVRASYLGSRRAEIVRAACARRSHVRVEGAPGEWLLHAIDVARRARALRGESTTMGEIEVGESDPLSRGRWLVALIGGAAARWSLAAISQVPDALLATALSELARRKPPSSWTFADLEHAGGTARATPAASQAEDFASAVAVALALSSDRKDEALDAVERDVFTSPLLRRAAADTLRRMGQAGRALALLATDHDPTVHALRAEIARRAGDRAAAEFEATAALEHDAADDRARAVLARLAIDAGEPRGALATLAGAPPTAATVEARAIALVASGERAQAEQELALAEALATTEESRGRVAGLIGYVAHMNGDFGRACSAFVRGADHAERAGALVEEATYLTGQAAAAVDQGDVAHALEAAGRASLLWEHLGRPADAATALLARAAAFSTAGAVLEATFAAREARERARWLGDRRAQAYACWAITDVL
ncbi:MAG TPA: protein kinase, partial [Polyangiaceae bacterium]